MMIMYDDDNYDDESVSRGGVLEPEGTVEIKFRYKDLSKMMHRLDPTCERIKEKLASPELSRAERIVLDQEMKVREELLMPIYRQAAVLFADLHDTAGRMQEKGVIHVSLHLLAHYSVFMLASKDTVEPRFTVTSVIRPPTQSRIISLTVKYKILVPLIWSPRYSGHFGPMPSVTIIVRFHCTCKFMLS